MRGSVSESRYFSEYPWDPYPRIQCCDKYLYSNTDITISVFITDITDITNVSVFVFLLVVLDSDL